MKANKTTNEELAKAIEKRVAEAASNWDFAPTLLETAARLRTFTLLSKAHQRLANDSVDYESNILRKLKVAEDALTELQDRCVASIHDGTIDPYEALKIAEDALAAIRGEGDNNENK